MKSFEFPMTKIKCMTKKLLTTKICRVGVKCHIGQKVFTK